MKENSMNHVNGETRLYGLMGNPVKHTMSPQIHNALAHRLDINMIYLPFHVGTEHLEAAVKGVKALGIKGFNITVPYKVEVLPFLDQVDDRARIIGAVNTVKVEGGRFFGYNTDIDGVYRMCEREGVTFPGKTVCILGAGGSAKAIAVLCASLGVKKIIMANRTHQKADEIRSAVLAYYQDMPFEIRDYNSLHDLEAIDICFQTTSVGLYPDLTASVVTDTNFFNKIDFAVDIIYNPSRTRFLTLCQESGVRTINGLGMLYFQAVKAFEIWHDITIPEKIVDEEYERFKELIDKV